MHVRDLLLKIAERGITLTYEGTEDRLNAKPASVLTPELIAALKTVVGIPHTLGGVEPLIIEARGVRHRIRAWVDPAGEPRVNYDDHRVEIRKDDRYERRCVGMSNEIEQKGAKKVTTEHQTTSEEEAYEQFLEEKRDIFSEAARTLVSEAQSASYTENLVHNVSYQPEEYEEAMEKMRLAATEITGRDLELLSRLWRLALAAAASIDPDDESHAGHRVTSGNVHWYYRMLAVMVEKVLQEKKMAELEEKRAELRYERQYTRAEWNPEYLDDDIPF